MGDPAPSGLPHVMLRLPGWKVHSAVDGAMTLLPYVGGGERAV